jgi:hypothetical protein
MVIQARWSKILKDIWGNKSRSLLVIFSIAVGVAAVGMINNVDRGGCCRGWDDQQRGPDYPA